VAAFFVERRSKWIEGLSLVDYDIVGGYRSLLKGGRDVV
jgi:hypothetical protein